MIRAFGNKKQKETLGYLRSLSFWTDSLLESKTQTYLPYLTITVVLPTTRYPSTYPRNSTTTFPGCQVNWSRSNLN